MREGKKFAVYFDQVNQTRFEITARNSDEAKNKAIKMWLKQYGWPSGAYVEDLSPALNNTADRRSAE